MCILASACGSSAGPSRSASVLTSCQKVSAVLSDGPDPTADPVGYAEAQILPLESVHTSDVALGKKIIDLDDAFGDVYESGASEPSMRELTRAESALDALCPGATG